VTPRARASRATSSAAWTTPVSLFAAWAQFDEAVQAMAREIAAAYICDLVVGIAPGGLYVGSALPDSPDAFDVRA